MGECAYYAKFRFSSPEAAEKAMPRLKEALKQVAKGHDFWQANRGKTPGEFWPALKARHPLLHRFLEVEGLTDGRLDGPIYMLDVGSEERGAVSLSVNGKDVNYQASGVWHHTDWTLIMRFLAKEAGASRFGWVSEEALDPFEGIELVKVQP